MDKDLNPQQRNTCANEKGRWTEVHDEMEIQAPLMGLKIDTTFLEKHFGKYLKPEGNSHVFH